MVPQLQRAQGRQLLREAEGYLEIVTIFEDLYGVDSEYVARLARRAIEILARLERSTDQRGLLRYLQGWGWLLLEEYDQALTNLHEAANWMPENTDVWLLQGRCHLQLGNLDMAVQATEEAFLANDMDARVHYQLARCWSLANSSKLAVAHLSRAIDLDAGYRDFVAGERDFDPIREDPQFVTLLSIVA